jgi:hypothetical protein
MHLSERVRECVCVCVCVCVYVCLSFLHVSLLKSLEDCMCVYVCVIEGLIMCA